MLNTNPLVTVICSCYNHSIYVEKSLDSVLNQTYSNIQLIIIDDCSNDNSTQVIENWISRNKADLFIKNKENLGLTKSVNQAFKNVKGAYFIDLAADDVLLPHCIETQVSVYKKYPNQQIGIVYGNAKVIDTYNNSTYSYFDKFPHKKKASKPKDGFIYQEIIDHTNTICSVSALNNTSIFKALGCYDENLVFEDYDFWLRVARKYPILYIEKVLVERTKLKKSLGDTNYLRFNKRALRFRYSIYLVVKKTFKLNINKDEDQASIKKILMEINGNLRKMNFLLILKYFILLIRFKYRSF